MRKQAVSVALGQSRSSTVRLLVIIVLVALTLRLAVVPFNRYLFEDLMDANHIHAWEPGNVAEALLAGRGFGSPFASNQPSAIMPPVYPLVVAVFFKVFGIHTASAIFAAHAFDCILGALSCIPVLLIARRSFGDRTARWAAWGWAFSPYGIYFAAAWAWSTQILIFCLLWLIYLAQRLEHSSQLRLWAGFGLLAGLAGLTEPSILTVVPFMMAIAAWQLARQKMPWLAPGLAASLALAAALSPWFIRNALVFHRFIPIRDSMGLELWMGNNGVSHSLDQTSDDLHPLHNMAELADYNRMGELPYMDQKMQQAKAYIRAYPGLYMRKCVRRAVYIWTAFWSFDSGYLAEDPTELADIPFATSLTLLTLIGLAVAWRRHRFEAIRYGGVLFLFPVMYYFTHPEPYHMRALDPLMVMLSIYAVVVWRERVRATAAISIPEAVAVTVALPVPEPVVVPEI
ncbi:MAG TPA: glycosyltransferase family 39 protein [Terracidiphilus sp.]|nr:glycosyltransferase family 39 protein [Terracidiphilus sp.]